jgi:UDP-N-acetylmuramate: L-alanyl-gamma-D-glutamyl-meso-diaminopimelate ligase
MEPEKKLSRTEGIYRQSANKQRIVILGNTAATIAAMVVHVLHSYHRRFDVISSSAGTVQALSPDAPVVIIVDADAPYATATGYHHHLGVLGTVDAVPAVLANITFFADATPKAGILIYPDTDPLATIGKRPRTDVTAIAYGTHLHHIEGGKVKLIVGQNEQFPVTVSGDENLRCLSAARELAIKIGVTPAQFYASITSFTG